MRGTGPSRAQPSQRARDRRCGRAARDPFPRMIALELDDVTRGFELPEGGSYEALAHVSLAVPQGCFAAIVGPSGCGKSTLLNLAAGLLTPSSGVVRVGGGTLRGLNRRAT